MTLTCSLFGHEFGEADVQRERQEEGSEVVTTIREVKTCTRCGAERVVSENTEVTTLETPSDIVGEDLDESPEDGEGHAAEPEADPDDAAATGSGGATGTATTDPEPEPEPEPEAEPEATTAAGPEADGGDDLPEGHPMAGGTDDTPAAEDDDGVILDDDPDEEADDRDRSPGAWPESDAEGETEAEEVGPASVSAAVAEWPDEPAADDEPDWTPDTGAGGRDLEGAEVEATGEAITVPEGSFHCPECGFSTPVEDSSLRAGDFCPECRRGALEHHT